MDAPDISTWIEAQNPPALVQVVELRSDNFESLPARAASEGGESVAEDLASGKFRLRAIKDAGIAMGGAQTALAWRYEQLLEFTKSQEGTLDRIASFAPPFVVDEYLLLPSITETRDRFDLSADQKEIRTMRVQYIMDQPPRAVTQPPTWRDYLWREYPYPEPPPHPALLPKNPEEEAVWEAAVEEGGGNQDWSKPSFRGRTTSIDWFEIFGGAGSLIGSWSRERLFSARSWLEAHLRLLFLLTVAPSMQGGTKFIR